MKRKSHGVDFDGTLAHFDGWKGPVHVGAPIPTMVDRVKRWLDAGDTVTICTARMAGPSPEYPDADPALAKAAVEAWCREHLGQVLEVTCRKGAFSKLWDDNAIQVLANTGRSFQEHVVERLEEALQQVGNARMLGYLTSPEDVLQELLDEFRDL